MLPRVPSPSSAFSAYSPPRPPAPPDRRRAADSPEPGGDESAFQPKRLRSDAPEPGEEASASPGSPMSQVSAVSPPLDGPDPDLAAFAPGMPALSLSPATEPPAADEPAPPLLAPPAAEPLAPPSDPEAAHAAEAADDAADDAAHNTSVDILVNQQVVIARACLVARDIDLDEDAGAVITCEADDGFAGLFTTQLGGAMALVVLPPEGLEGIVYMRHAAVTGATLVEESARMLQAYAIDAAAPGRFFVAYATTPIWDDLNATRLAQQAEGRSLQAVVDGLITDLGLDLPLSEAAALVPGSPPPVPEAERFRQVCEAAAQAHAARAEALADALGGQAVRLPTPAVFATWRGDLIQFDVMPDHAPAAPALPAAPVAGEPPFFPFVG